MRRDALELGSDARLAHQMIGMSNHAILRINIGAIIRSGLDVDDFPVGVPDQKVRGAATVRLHHRQQGLVECPGIQDLAAANMERLAESIGPVPVRYQPVHAQADSRGIHSHLATDDAGFSETDEIRLVLPRFRGALNAHHKDVALHFLQPVPILADQRVATRRHFRHQPESCAAFLLLSRRAVERLCFGAEHAVGQFVTRVQQSDFSQREFGSGRDARHLFGVLGIIAGNELTPRIALLQHERQLCAASLETLDIGCVVVANFRAHAAPMHSPALSRIRTEIEDRQFWHRTDSLTVAAP